MEWIKHFELRLIVIAIIIPLFFDTLPKVISGILFPPLTFELPLLFSYVLGASWFFVLMDGLSILKSRNEGKNKYSRFENIFGKVVVLTKVILIGIFSAYFLYGAIAIFEYITNSYEISLLSALFIYVVLSIIIRLNKYVSD